MTRVCSVSTLVKSMTWSSPLEVGLEKFIATVAVPLVFVQCPLHPRRPPVRLNKKQRRIRARSQNRNLHREVALMASDRVPGDQLICFRQRDVDEKVAPFRCTRPELLGGLRKRYAAWQSSGKAQDQENPAAAHGVPSATSQCSRRR